LRLLRLGLAAALVMAALTSGSALATAAGDPVQSIPAGSETTPVGHSGDAADDPAIWVDRQDASRSLILGDDKKGALETYNLDGTRHQRVTTSVVAWGNVDVRSGVRIGTRTLDIAAAINGGTRIFAIDRSTRDLTNVTDGAKAAIKTGGGGLCLYTSAISGDTFVFVVRATGVIGQYVLRDNDQDGLVEGALVRTVSVPSKAEGCVGDDANGALYVAEEKVGVWRFGAEPTAGSGRASVDTVAGAGHLTADVEGITIVDRGAGAGYLIASAQNAAAPKQSYFVVYDRQTNAYLKSFRIGAGPNADGCEKTDGVAAYAGDLGAAFPSGVFVCQDNKNTVPGVGNQDFKLTRLETVVDLH
jgi:3-phytase